MALPTEAAMEAYGEDLATLSAVVNGEPTDVVEARLGHLLITLSGIPALIGSRLVPFGVPVFVDASGDVSTPAGATAVLATCVSGGGSGGSAPASPGNASAGSGGGGAGLSESFLENPGATITLVIGAGGAAPAAGANNGNAGGDTTAYSSRLAAIFCKATGGAGGKFFASSADDNIEGGAGGNASGAIGNLRTLSGDSGGYALVVGTASLGGRGGRGADGQAGGKEAMSSGNGHGPGGGGMCRGDPVAKAGGVGRDGYAILQFYTEV